MLRAVAPRSLQRTSGRLRVSALHRHQVNALRRFSTEPSATNRRGNFFITLGWAMLGVLAIDQALQYKHSLEAQERLDILQAMQEEADQENQHDMSSYNNAPTLFQCQVMHTEPSLDGSKMLRNVHVGDKVEVVEAEVGPNQMYHLCRTSKGFGWYPVPFLKRLG